MYLMVWEEIQRPRYHAQRSISTRCAVVGVSKTVQHCVYLKFLFPALGRDSKTKISRPKKHFYTMCRKWYLEDGPALRLLEISISCFGKRFKDQDITLKESFLHDVP